MGKQAGIDDSGDPLWASSIQNRVRDNMSTLTVRLARCRVEGGGARGELRSTRRERGIIQLIVNTLGVTSHL